MDHSKHSPAPDKRSVRAKWVWIGFALVAAFFLWTEHRAHVLGALPYVLVLACPLMHIFMHGGHGHHGHHHGGETSRPRQAGQEGERQPEEQS